MIEKEILESYINKGISVKEIAEKLNKSTTTIFRYMKKYEIKSTIGSQGARRQRFDENFFEINDNVLSLEASSKSAIIEMYDYLYRDATIYLDRKKDKYENIMSRLVEMQGQ